MNLRLRNSWKYDGEDRWDWAVFLEDNESGEIDNVKYVEYHLHSSFPDSRRKATDPTNKFQIETNGWGTFTIKAIVYLKDGNEIKLAHYLYLTAEPEVGVTG